LRADPVHLEHPLCSIQSICRSIHSGPPFLKCLCRNSTLGRICRSVLEAVNHAHLPEGRAVSIPSRSTPVLGITRSGVAIRRARGKQGCD
jgi:hypothetical protein